LSLCSACNKISANITIVYLSFILVFVHPSMISFTSWFSTFSKASGRTPYLTNKFHNTPTGSFITVKLRVTIKAIWFQQSYTVIYILLAVLSSMWQLRRPSSPWIPKINNICLRFSFHHLYENLFAVVTSSKQWTEIIMSNATTAVERHYNCHLLLLLLLLKRQRSN